jgi:hypothetical protein
MGAGEGLPAVSGRTYRKDALALILLLAIYLFFFG